MTTPTNTEAVDWKKRIFEIYKNSCGDGLRSAHFESIGISQIAQEIRQTHLDLLGEVEREVIEQDQLVPGMDRNVAYNWLRIEAQERNKLRIEQRKKLSHIITRVEGS